MLYFLGGLFFYGLAYFSKSIETCWFWYRLSSFGWCLFPGTMLHFFILLTNNESKLNKWRVLLLLYTPGIILIYKAYTDFIMTKGFVESQYGWHELGANHSFWYWFYLAYCSYLAIGLFLTWKWGKDSKLIREKKQSKIIVYSSFAGLLIGIIRGFVLPGLQIYYIPFLVLDSLVTLIWTGGIGYAIIQYKLMAFSASMASDEIINTIGDLIILIDTNDRIIKINSRVCDILGYDSEELLGKICSQNYGN